MNPRPLRPPLTLTVEPAADGALVVRIAGDLDHETCDELLERIRTELDTGPRALCLDFAELGVIDSMGLATLLMIHRHTRQAGVPLRLGRRPEHLERFLTVTGTLEHLVADDGAPSTAAPAPRETADSAEGPHH